MTREQNGGRSPRFGKPLTRRQVVVGGAAGVVLGGAAILASTDSQDGAEVVAERVLGELATFTNWLAQNDERGFIGEVGWPGSPREEAERWGDVARRWYAAADAAGLWVTNWAAGEWWPKSYRLATYRARGPGGALAVAGPQAQVIEASSESQGVLRGVCAAGGAFGAPSTDDTATFSNSRPGTVEVDYHYDKAESFRYLASRGIELVRIEFRWERLQRDLLGPLDQGELGRLRTAAHQAARAGLTVVLDLHNYGSYYLEEAGRGRRASVGSELLPAAALTDFWTKFSAEFADDRRVRAYGLMNEPADLESRGSTSPARVWEQASQEVVTALRSRGDRKLLMVPGYAYSGVQEWSRQHPRPWITDPLSRIRYEAHHYWDTEHSSHYRRSFAQEAASL